MDIAHARIDDRLIHGQVVTAWLQAIDLDTDEEATDYARYAIGFYDVERRSEDVLLLLAGLVEDVVPVLVRVPGDAPGSGGVKTVFAHGIPPC